MALIMYMAKTYVVFFCKYDVSDKRKPPKIKISLLLLVLGNKPFF